MAVIEEVEAEETVAETEGAKQEEKKETAKKEAKAPAPPPAPELKISQFVPMIAMFALQKYNLEEMGLVRHVEIGYVVVQLLCFGVLYLTYQKIEAMADNGKKIKIPEVKQMGQVVTPAKEQTAKEYDSEKLKEAVKQPLIGFVILGGIYYKWGSVFPLVMQMLMTPLQLYEAPLTQIHLLGKELKRPFPAPSMFGMPSAPEPAEEEEDAAVENKKEK
eukprot:TRINITY_DN55878_c0_g1_i1.p1 TRINITY_DN55878_c0_g1~~TRINITY_DN55878_c0_g1_i1.p1  ORF type:complete len:218 (+),score=83.06 TRINITY_DN55878_c0_g1_i1:199-852(+)